MLASIFSTVNFWMTGAPVLAAFGCLVWGMISVVFSPCQMASLPLIIGYVGGQEQALSPRQGIFYAISFSLGLFLSITAVGVTCALVGRILGDVGNYWQIPVGLILLWVAFGMLGPQACSTSHHFLNRLNVRGIGGALILGLVYGIVAGSCTFGFVAPILAVITIQHQVIAGIVYIVCFALGHCLPIAVAGSSTAVIRQLLESSTWQGIGHRFRTGAAVIIALIGLYFIGNPFWGT